MVALPGDSVEIPKILPRFIYITGCDGTGKSTQTHLLLQQLQAAGVKTRHVWLRFPFFFSLPLLAYARWRGYSWHEIFGTVDHGYWDFSRSRLIQNFLPWLLLVDASIAGISRIYLPMRRGETVVCERFVLDMLVDLSVAFGGKNIFTHPPGKLYLKLLPANARIFLLDLDAATIQARRPDLRTDKFLSIRLEAYRRLAQELSLRPLSSSLQVQTVNQFILNAICT